MCDTVPSGVTSSCGAVSLSTCPSKVPPVTHARRALGSTRTERNVDRSICMPRSQVDWPEWLCPPHFTATSKLLARAKFTAAWMSGTSTGCTISAGCLSNDGLRMRRASS